MSRVEQLLQWASITLKAQNIAACDTRAAQWVIDVLGAGFPCGFAHPEPAFPVEASGLRPAVSLDFGGPFDVTPDDARGIAVAILKAADEAEAGQ